MGEKVDRAGPAYRRRETRMMVGKERTEDEGRTSQVRMFRPHVRKKKQRWWPRISHALQREVAFECHELIARALSSYAGSPADLQKWRKSHIFLVGQLSRAYGLTIERSVHPLTNRAQLR